MSILKSRPEENQGEGAPEWLTTYSDLVTLLLTFFVLLFSMAQVDKDKFEAVAQSLQTSFAGINAEHVNQGDDFIKLIDNYINEESLKQQKLDNAKKQIEEYLAESEFGDNITLIENDDELILRFDSVILFDLGKAELKKPAQEVLEMIGDMLNQLEHDIVVQGHTDDLPIETLLYPSNWELSTKRATNVVLFLVDVCGLDPKRFTATGNAEFRPIRPNDTEENRAKNRRIDIAIVK